MKAGYYHKPGRIGRAWYVFIAGADMPLQNEQVTVTRKNGIVNTVSVFDAVRHVDKRGIEGWLCRFNHVAGDREEFESSEERSERIADETAREMGVTREPKATSALADLAEASLGNPESESIKSAVRSALAQSRVELDTAVKDCRSALHSTKQIEESARQMVDGLDKRVAQALAVELAKVVNVKINLEVRGEVKEMGIQHKSFPKLVQYIGLGLNVWLPGPAGSGKTMAAYYCAKALSLSYYHSPKVLMEHSLLGYKDAHGIYHRTTFRDAYENGGLFLLDEADGSEAKALIAINMAIENDSMAFPDGIIKRHADFRLIAAANTYGHGGDADYVGRNQQDKAFLSRFVTLDWPYDEAFELAIAIQAGSGYANVAGWVARVQHLRAAAKAKGIRALITPRASKNGAIMLAAGIPQLDVEAATIRQAMTREQWVSIGGAI